MIHRVSFTTSTFLEQSWANLPEEESCNIVLWSYINMWLNFLMFLYPSARHFPTFSRFTLWAFFFLWFHLMRSMVCRHAHYSLLRGLLASKATHVKGWLVFIHTRIQMKFHTCQIVWFKQGVNVSKYKCNTNQRNTQTVPNKDGVLWV